jgi:hypothetical protein
MMRIGRECGYFVTYNHPVWSRETYNDYCAFENMHAMEICNYGCIVEGYDDDNPRVYDDMLGSGKRIYCIATDDNHCRRPIDDPKFDAFGGFTMIKAPSLTYTAVTSALKNGDCYASQAPTINELYVENGRLHIECSRVREVIYRTVDRRAERRMSPSGITSADFNISAKSTYFRIEIVDFDGYRAVTRAYPAAKYGK